jgi:transposase
MYATRSRMVKTDRRDARALAEACLLGAYRPAHRLSDPQRHVRGRLLVRDALVRTRTRYISVIRALLRQQGYRVPSGSAEHFILRVQRLPLPGRLLSVVAPLLAFMRPLNQQLAYCDERIEHLAVQDPRVPRLRSVPSVGPVTAAAFLATVDDPQRFRHAHQLEAYLGLVPREYSSGEMQRRGPITKAGHSRTRWLLIQAAVSILRPRPPPRRHLYALLRDGSVFELQRVRPLGPRLLLSSTCEPFDAGLTMRALVSRRLDGWMSAKCCLAAIAGSPRMAPPPPRIPSCPDGLTHWARP